MADKNLTPREWYVWEIFERHSDDPARRDPPAKDKTQLADKQPHVSAQDIVRGNLAKGCASYTNVAGTKLESQAEYYNWNAWNYIGSGADGTRNIYGAAGCDYYRFFKGKYRPNFYAKFPRNKVASRMDITRWLESLKARENKTPEALDAIRYLEAARGRCGKSGETGQFLPYRWQGHHILPMNCFYKYFELGEIMIVLRSDYDINCGSNIIFLPEEEADRHHHVLPNHFGDHPQYDERVKTQFQQIRDAIRQKMAEKQPHDSIAMDLAAKLRQIETDNFKYIHKVLGLQQTRLV
jgi:hypothetical protein